MEIMRPSSYHHHNMSSNWAAAAMSGGETSPTMWTVAENKMFEDALAVFDADASDRWQQVAALIPSKTVADVVRHYRELVDDVSDIEAGRVPIPGYDRSFSTYNADFRVVDCYRGGGKRSRPFDHERKKGIPWSEKEHKLFLLGLQKHGRGDWRNISRNFVITRTPTQVASHAQKYFNRQMSGGKDKRRASIHDITTVNLNENTDMPSLDRLAVLSHHTPSISVPQFQWNNHSRNEINQNLFMFPNSEMNPNESFQYDGAHHTGFQMNSAYLCPQDKMVNETSIA